MAASNNEKLADAISSIPAADMNRSMEESPSPPAGDDQPMAAIEQNHNNDVLCGRGVTTNRHPGNERFRALVSANKELYVSSSKRDKMAISRSIVEAVRARKPPGRFLEKDVDNCLWYDIGDKKAIEKTSQALRDGAASLRKQLSDDMSDPNFLEAVFDGVDASKHGVGVRRDKVSKPGTSTKKAGPGHRRTNSSPAVTGRSSASLKRKSPSCDKSSAEILASDEKSQKEALERISGSASGTGAPFRPDRRPSSRHHHKRTASAGSIPIGRLFSRQSQPGYPYPRQTPPSSPNPYTRPSPPVSPYYGGYHLPNPMSPFPPSPAYGRSYSWGCDHLSLPPPPPPPPPRQNSDPSPMNSPIAVGSYYNGPPSPVAFAARKSPPTYPYSPRKGHNAYHYHNHAPPSPRPQHHPLSPASLPRSPRHHNHHHQQPQHYTDDRNHYQSHHPGQYPALPAREGYPPRSPRTSDVGDEGDRPGPSPLSIPTLGQSRQGNASGTYVEESSGRDKSYMPPPPAWYPDPQMSPQRPRNDRFSCQSEQPSPPMSADAPQSSSSVAQRQYSSPRTKLLPSRLRDNNPFSPSEDRSNNDAFKVTSDQDHPKQRRAIRFSQQDAAPKVEAPRNGPFGIAEEASSAPPPEQICKSFTFVDGQLMENDVPAITTSQPNKLMTMNPKQITFPSDSPNTPKAVDAVDRFDVENADTGKEVNFGSTGSGPRPRLAVKIDVDVDADADADVKKENPALPDFCFSKVDDDMLILDDRSLSPLPFDDANMQDEHLIDLEYAHLFAPPRSSPTRDLDI